MAKLFYRFSLRNNPLDEEIKRILRWDTLENVT